MQTPYAALTQAFKTSLLLEDQSKWKSMGDLSGYSILGNQNVGKLLMGKAGDVFEEEEALEAEFKTLIKKYREAKKLFTRFNDELSFVLASALQCYELNKLTGANVSSDSFQSAIKNVIPDGHVFKAFPIQQTHKNSVKMFETIRMNGVAEDILNTLGDQINFAVRVKIVPYPEDIFALWVIVGVHYVEI